MSTQEFKSLNLSNEADKFFNERIKPTIDVSNNAYKKLKPILEKDSNFFNVEFNPGMSLNSLANDYLGNSFAWQIIADANKIDPTKRIDLGTQIRIPKIEELKKSIQKFIIDSPQGKQFITDTRESVLNLLGIKDKEVAKQLEGCAEKIINFKI